MIVIYAGWDAVDAGHVVARFFARGRTAGLRTAKSCGPDAPMLAFKSRGVFCAATVTTKPGHRGEHEIRRKAIAQGMPVETGEPVEDYPHFVRTTGASDTRHSPRPLLRVALRPLTFGAAFSCKPRTYVVARTKTRIWSSPRTRGPTRRVSSSYAVRSIPSCYQPRQG